MADYAHEETERQLKELEARIERIYMNAASEMVDTVDSYWESYKARDEKERQRYKDGEITQQQYYQWRLNQEGRGERYEKMLDNLAERYTEANEVAVAYVNDATPSIYALNRNFEAYEIESSGADVAFDIWDEQTVKRLIVEDPDLMPNYPEEKAIKRGIDLAYGKQQITASVTSGILQGKSVTKIADDLMKRINTMSRTSAVRAARTAFTQAQNAGRQDTMEAAEDMGIKMEKVWLATLDANTRPEHAEADGQRVGVKDTFIVGGERMEYPGDRAGSGWNVYNCRCTMVSVPEGMDLNNAQRWARDPVTGERSLVSNMTYKDWYDWRTNGGNMSYEAYQQYKANGGAEAQGNQPFTSADESVNIKTTTTHSTDGILTEAETIARIEQSFKSGAYSEAMKITDFRDRGDAMKAVTNSLTGYDALPTVVSEEEFKELSEGKELIYRGVHDGFGKTAEEILDELRYGPLWTGSSGNAFYGRGIYFSNSTSIADSYSGGAASGGAYCTAIFKDDARIVNYEDIFTEMCEAMSVANSAEYYDLIADEGEYGAFKGYDAMVQDFGNGEKYIVVLNRNALIIEE